MFAIVIFPHAAFALKFIDTKPNATNVEIISFLIFVHELGHLLAAKWSGIGVSEFSVGMGPKLTGFLYGDTQYNLRLFPLGGFVKLAGLDDTDDQFDETMFFQNRPLLHRVITISAGSIMNVFLGFVIFVGLN